MLSTYAIKISICLVLLVSTVGSIQGNAITSAQKFDLLKGAVARMLRTTEIASKMSCRRGGASLDMFVTHLKEHETEVYNLYSEERLRNRLGRALGRDLQDNVFKMVVDVNSAGKATRYFIGKKPDLEAILADILSLPEISEKLEWINGGLAMDEIIMTMVMRHKDVYPLYIGASIAKRDHGLRTRLGEILVKLLQSNVFRLLVDAGGRRAYRYFYGQAPDLKAIAKEVITTPELHAKMELENGGLTVDDIIGGIITLHPDVYLLYMRASGRDSDHGLRVALGKVLGKEMQDEVFSKRVNVDGELVIKYFWAAEYTRKDDLKNVLAAVFALPEIKAKLRWRNGGATIDDFIKGIIKLHPDVYSTYLNAAHNVSDRGLRIAVGRLLPKVLMNKFFVIIVDADSQRIRKYFRGTAPDFKQIAAEIVALPEINTKMAAENAGVSLDTIIAVVADRYPDVYALYTQASNYSNEQGIRVILGTVLASTNGVVARNIKEVGKRYFWGS